MKYNEIIEVLRNNYAHGIAKINKEELMKLYKKIYANDNQKTFENMTALLKSNNIIKSYSKDVYLISEKSMYEFKITEEIRKIYKLISKEYSRIKFDVWNTCILNEFTHHYIMLNYNVVEVEKIALELVVTLLKEKYAKKYTVVTEKMYVENRNIFLNDENILIVRPLILKAPLEKDKNGMYKPTIEKVMVDIYKDKVFLQYQGHELKRIYENILKKYDIDFKKLYAYANLRTNIDEFKRFINSLDINDVYKE